MNKLISCSEAVNRIESGMRIMLGGFFYSGLPMHLVRALTARKGQLHDLTLISNDAGTEFMHPEAPGNALIETGMFKKCICSFIGHNDAAMKLIAAGQLEMEMMPMGTFAERIRIGGAGIGGFLTPTGLNTAVAEGKEIIRVDGRDYLLEKPLKADIALIYGSVVEEYGNVFLNGVAKNFNVTMATAADYVIVEAKRYVKGGEIDPSVVSIPAPYVDAIVKAEDCV